MNSKIASFGSLLGLSYYLTGPEFEKLLEQISLLWPHGSSIVFDYPSFETESSVSKTRLLAKEAHEEMKTVYTYQKIERMLENCGFMIYEHLNYEEMTRRFFDSYNRHNPDHPMSAPEGVCYCLAVRK